MEWPFVSRRLHEQMIALLMEECAGWRTLADNIVARYHDLKLQGGTPTPPPIVPLASSTPDPVYQAITDVAGNDRVLRGIMSREAQRARAAGIDDLDIVQQIQHGVSDDDIFSM